jgi:hypothetical protein
VIQFAEPLHRNETIVSHADPGTRQGFMDHTIEMGPGGTICTPDIIKIGPGIQKLIVGNSETRTNRGHEDRISLV